MVNSTRLLWQHVTAMVKGPRSAPVTVVPSCQPDVASINASDEGSAITAYNIESSYMDGDFASLATVSASASSYIATGLSNGDSYQFRISASNANGTSDESSPVSVTPSTSPSAVRNVHIVGNASELQIIWDAPLNFG